MPFECKTRSISFTSLAASATSPVVATLAGPVGWKFMAIAEPIASCTSMAAELGRKGAMDCGAPAERPTAVKIPKKDSLGQFERESQCWPQPHLDCSTRRSI